VEKWLWTETDFDVMGWHDSRIHALAFSPNVGEMIFDIDYILQWLHPKPNETHFQFWVSPATLVFENVYDAEFDIGSYNGGLEIDIIKREDAGSPHNAQLIGKDKEWQWIIECQEGEIRFRSTGYKQYIRANPVFGGQALESQSRGFSFDRGQTN
jgi:hypothetical protein